MSRGNVVPDIGKQNYSRLSSVTSSPKFTFRPRTRINGANSDTPGPGAYEAPDAHNHFKFNGSAKFGFGTESRDRTRNSGSPGPGAYQSPQVGSVGDRKQPQAPPQFRFGSEKRMSSPHEKARDVPGPGAYEAPKHGGVGEASMPNKPPNWSFGSTQRMSSPHAHVRATPGPGAYSSPKHGAVGDRKIPACASPQWRFGTQERSPAHQARAARSEKPGPGSYDTHTHANVGEGRIMKKSPQYRFGSTVKMHQPHKHLNDTPGPGSYGDVFGSFGH